MEISTETNNTVEKKVHRFSTRTADGYRATDISTGADRYFWSLRFPFKSDTSEHKSFKDRLSRIDGLDIIKPKYIDFGVDSQSLAYLITGFIEVNSPIEQEVKAKYATFTEIVRLVSKLHEAEVLMGDITEDTFGVNLAGDVILMGTLGAFEMATLKTAKLPPAQTLQYLAPELKSGSSVQYETDIFSLGVLGYRLFTGTYPPETGHQPPNFVRKAFEEAGQPNDRNIVPILEDCLRAIPQERYSNATGLLTSLTSGVSLKQKSGISIPKPVQVSESRPLDVDFGKSEISSHLSSGSSSKNIAQSGSSLRVKKKDKPKGRDRNATVILSKKDMSDKKDLYLAFGLSILVASVLGSMVLFWLKASKKSSKAKAPIVQSKTETQLPQNIKSFEERSVDNKIVPTEIHYKEDGYDNLQRVLSKVRSSSIYEARAVEMLAGLLQEKDILSISFEQFQDLADLDSNLAGQVIAAVALDTEEPKYVDWLRLNYGTIQQYPLSALLISQPSLAMFVEESTVKAMSSWDRPTLFWTMEKLLGNPMLDDVLVAAKKLYPSVFVNSMSSQNSNNLNGVLLAAAGGKYSREGVIEIAQSGLNSIDEILFEIASAGDHKVSVEAFDTLAGMGDLDGDIAILVSWVKKRHWDERGNLIGSICSLLGGGGQSEKLEQSVKNLLPYFAKDGKNELVSLTSSYALQKVLELDPNIFSTDELLQLLVHSSPEVRIAVVKSLYSTNDVSTLQIVKRAYKKESNESVLDVYRNHPWFAGERVK